MSAGVPAPLLVALVGGALLLGLGATTLLGRWRGRLALGLGLLGLLLALLGGALRLPELPGLVGALGLGGPLSGVLGWALIGLLAAALGGPALPGPAWLRALLGGALLGELGAVVWIAHGTRPAGGEGGAPAGSELRGPRTVLCAMAGALLAPGGDAVGAALGPGTLAGRAVFLGAGLALLLLAAPWRGLGDLPRGRPELTAILLVLGLLPLLAPPHQGLVTALGLLALGALALGRRARPRLDLVAWTLGSLLLALLGVLAGLPQLLVQGIDLLALDAEPWLPPLFMGAAGLLVLLVGEPAAALLLGAVDAQALSAEGWPGGPDGLRLGLLLGAGLACRLPLHIGGAARYLLPRLLLVLGVAMVLSHGGWR